MQISRSSGPSRVGLKLLLCGLFVLVALQSCATSRPENNQPELVVAAAANLTNVSSEIAQRFNQETGVRLVFTFGATADLAKQIENGAPFDVFVAADMVNVERLQKQGLLSSDTPQVYARGRLVMWIPANSPLRLQNIQDLTKADFERIAIAKPDVAPYGEAAVQSLRASGVWDQIAPKVVYGQNVAQVKQFVATGNAEVAFIPLALLKPEEGSFREVDPALYQPIQQAVGVITRSSKQKSAQQFVEFLLSDAGQGVFEAAGYVRVR